MAEISKVIQNSKHIMSRVVVEALGVIGRRCIAKCAQDMRMPCRRHCLAKSFSTRASALLAEEDEQMVDRISKDILSGNNDAVDDSDGAIARRIALSKAITLVESKSPRKREMADVLLGRLKQSAPKEKSPPSFRLGVAGPPGVGKSTFVEALGMHILGLHDGQQEQEKECFHPEKLAVLCIDPSSHVTGGSILGDKTRMSNLSYHPRAYIRPSPSSGTLGGLGSYTYDAASLCELAGYQLTIIETVGVGQSEVELAECCDLFLLMLAPGGGDELQGSKKGIVEVADVLVVNKADGETKDIARRTANEYRKAMGLLRKPAGWWGGSKETRDDGNASAEKAPTAPPVLLVSAHTGYGLKELWDTITKYQQYAQSSGHLLEKRRLQNRYWMWKYLREHVLETATKDPRVKQRKDEIERSLDSGLVAPRVAAAELWRNIVGDADTEMP